MYLDGNILKLCLEIFNEYILKAKYLVDFITNDDIITDKDKVHSERDMLPLLMVHGIFREHIGQLI